MDQKIKLKHPEGKKSISMDKIKYELLSTALLKHLKSKGESTFTEIWQTISEDFRKKQINFQGSIQWHLEWVKLNLEATKKIRRISDTSPEKYTLVN